MLCYGDSGFYYIPPKSVNMFDFGENELDWTQTVNHVSWVATAILVQFFHPELASSWAAYSLLWPCEMWFRSQQRFEQFTHRSWGSLALTLPFLAFPHHFPVVVIALFDYLLVPQS